MGEVRDEFPEDTLDIDYEINCQLPDDRIGSLIGDRGSNVKWVEDTTGASVKFSKKDDDPSNRTMTISGPLQAVYMAHMLMMKQYHVSEQEAIKKEKKAELAAQIAALQQQVAELASSK